MRLQPQPPAANRQRPTQAAQVAQMEVRTVWVRHPVGRDAKWRHADPPRCHGQSPVGGQPVAGGQSVGGTMTGGGQSPADRREALQLPEPGQSCDWWASRGNPRLVGKPVGVLPLVGSLWVVSWSTPWAER